MRTEFAAIVILVAGLAAGTAAGQSNNICDQPGEVPDLVIGNIDDLLRWGSSGGITAFSLANTSCNVGTCWLGFDGSSPNHPVVSQGLFRLKAGRFEQIGQSWVKHIGGALQDDYCGACLPAPDGTHLGVRCSDLYNAFVNGQRYSMGPRYEVDPYTGADPYPYTHLAQSGVLDGRLQVHDSDLDPVGNLRALYFAEIQMIAADDAAAGTAMNDWSYRPVVVTRTGSDYGLLFTGPTVVGRSAFSRWSELDPSVVVSEASLPGDGVMAVGAKVTWLGNGTWRYEYAVANLTSYAAPIAFSVPVPQGTSVTNASFHDVDYHSGDPQDDANWSRATGATAVNWTAHTLVFGGQVPNCLRWGTIYNFRFVANAAPGTHSVTAGFSLPPHSPYEVSLSIPTLTPSLCDNDGACDPGETCTTCPSDCNGQGGGAGCCGNGSCESGESAGTCFTDCGAALASETFCGDGVDGDRDGLIDCFDPDCCSDSACEALDLDGDGSAVCCDCNNADTDIWSTPGEVRDLLVEQNVFGGTVLTWSAPVLPGGTTPLYDAIRSPSPEDFAAKGACLTTAYPSAPFVNDPESPSPGHAFHYLVRARNACASGSGPLGSGSSGIPHTAPACP